MWPSDWGNIRLEKYGPEVGEIWPSGWGNMALRLGEYGPHVLIPKSLDVPASCPCSVS